MATKPLIQQLQRLPVFRAVAESELAELAEHGTFIRYVPGDPVVVTGRRPRAVTLVLTGALHHASEDGVGAISARPGDCAGVTGMFTTATPATRTLVAGDDCTCLRLDPAWLAAKQDQAAVAALELAGLADLARRLRVTHREVRRAWHQADKSRPRDATVHHDAAPGLFARLKGLFGGGA